MALAMSQTGESDRTAWVALAQLVSKAQQTLALLGRAGLREVERQPLRAAASRPVVLDDDQNVQMARLRPGAPDPLRCVRAGGGGGVVLHVGHVVGCDVEVGVGVGCVLAAEGRDSVTRGVGGINVPYLGLSPSLHTRTQKCQTQSMLTPYLLPSMLCGILSHSVTKKGAQPSSQM